MCWFQGCSPQRLDISTHGTSRQGGGRTAQLPQDGTTLSNPAGTDAPAGPRGCACRRQHGSGQHSAGEVVSSGFCVFYIIVLVVGLFTPAKISWLGMGYCVYIWPYQDGCELRLARLQCMVECGLHSTVHPLLSGAQTCGLGVQQTDDVAGAMMTSNF